ncbi:MAG: hypothetical protein NC452_10210 [Eubacterium sp.]|nr:hypothetical protein [Eubacterium sp.]
MTCNRTVRFYLCGSEDLRALAELEDGERLEDSFNYVDLSVDVTVCKSIFKLDSSGGVLMNGVYHSLNVYGAGSAAGNASLVDFTPSTMHSHLASVSEDFDFLALFDPVCGSDLDAVAYGRLSEDMVTAADLRQCLTELGN